MILIILEAYFDFMTKLSHHCTNLVSLLKFEHSSEHILTVHDMFLGSSEENTDRSRWKRRKTCQAMGGFTATRRDAS